MALGVIGGNRTHPFDSCGVGSQALQGLGWDRRQSFPSVRLGWHGMPGASWPWVRSKAIELTRLTCVVWDPRRFKALGAIEGNRSRPFVSGGTGCQALHGLGCDRRQSTSPSLTRVARDAKRFMALGAIEGNRPRQFDSGGAGCQALHGLGCDRRQSTSPV